LSYEAWRGAMAPANHRNRIIIPSTKITRPSKTDSGSSLTMGRLDDDLGSFDADMVFAA
jgi:hypothetical protein